VIMRKKTSMTTRRPLLDEEDASSDDGSESSVNYDVEDTTNQEQLAKNN
jgi:hypothetical protein